MIGTPYYMAPEVCNGDYTSKCDIWSIGVISFMILCGKAPFFGKSNEAIFAMARKGPVMKPNDWKNVSEGAKEFIRSLLTVDYKERPTCEEALNHKWLQKNYRRASVTANKKEGMAIYDTLSNFKAHNVLKKAAYEYLGSQLATHEERNNIDKVFKALDTHNTGTLSKSDIMDGYFT